MNYKNAHSWINFPNKGNRKCTKCGCIHHKTTKDKKPLEEYILNGITYEKSPQCIIKTQF